jgi:hypothetical protein
MTRFLQKFDQLPKLSLGGELGRASINGKFADLTAPTRKRYLYLITFHPCQSVSECLPSYIPAALRLLLVGHILYSTQLPTDIKPWQTGPFGVLGRVISVEITRS